MYLSSVLCSLFIPVLAGREKVLGYVNNVLKEGLADVYQILFCVSAVCAGEPIRFYLVLLVYICVCSCIQHCMPVFVCPPPKDQEHEVAGNSSPVSSWVNRASFHRPWIPFADLPFDDLPLTTGIASPCLPCSSSTVASERI